MARVKQATQSSKKNPPFLVTEVYVKLLEGVFTYHLITASQLCRLYYSPKSITLVKTRLKHLTDHSYLLALNVPTTKGNSPHIYTLARKGLNLLKENGFAVNEYFRPSQEVDKEKNYLFLAHTIETNDFLICASKFPLFAPAYSL